MGVIGTLPSSRNEGFQSAGFFFGVVSALDASRDLSRLLRERSRTRGLCLDYRLLFLSSADGDEHESGLVKVPSQEEGLKAGS